MAGAQVWKVHVCLTSRMRYSRNFDNSDFSKKFRPLFRLKYRKGLNSDWSAPNQTFLDSLVTWKTFEIPDRDLLDNLYLLIYWIGKSSEVFVGTLDQPELIKW